MRATLLFVSRLLYVAATLALLALAFAFVVYAGWSVWQTLVGRTPVLSAMLSAVGLIIIALAVSDVGRFLLQEELVGSGERETTADIRRTLAKFITIVVIAASLEALVIVFEAGRDEVSDVLYPAALLGVVALLLGVLGFYQRASHVAEHLQKVDAERGLPADPEARKDEP